MRVLLVTLSGMLPFALTQVLNPSLEYCAIVVDEPEISKKILEKDPSLRDKIFPFYELKECVKDFYYDVVICIYDRYKILDNEIIRCCVPKNKLINLFISDPPRDIFFVERALRYYKEHAEDFEIFATGGSHTEKAVIPEKFKYKLFNFGRGSQDLYYEYQIAKFIFGCTAKLEKSPLKYALICLAPFSFHFDESKAIMSNFLLLQYAIAFNDLHNFWMPFEQYQNLFRQEFLNYKLPFDAEMNCIKKLEPPVRYITVEARIAARERIDMWRDLNFPETRKEYVKILDDYLTLCEENNVRPIIFLQPTTQGYKKYFSRQKLDEFHYLIHETQQKHPAAIFLDGWKWENFSDMDFGDVDHLNLNGAAKFSTILNNFIESLEKG